MTYTSDRGQVMQRYHGCFANRTRVASGRRRRRRRLPPALGGGLAADDPELPEGGFTIVEAEVLSRGDARRRRAEPIRPVYAVDPLARSRCGADTRVTALIQEAPVVDKMLKQLRDKGRDARAGPWATVPPGEGASVAAA